MEFVSSIGPATRTKKSTTKIMLILTGALSIVWLAGVVFNFVANGSDYGVKAILMLVVAEVAAILSDILVLSIRYNEKKGPYGEYLLHQVITQYSWVTAIIFTLTLPIGTPYYVVAIGTIFGVIIAKHIFGGFGSNIFNPAIFGRILVGLAFGAQLTSTIEGAGAPSSLVGGVTVTSAFDSLTNWLSADLSKVNLNLGQLWLGTYNGALGETFTALILLLGIGLVALKVINWRTPVFYLGTVVLTSLFIAIFIGVNPLEYILIQLAMGGLMFGAVFMLTDPVSGPTSMFGKSLIGVIAGFLTVLIRIQGSYPEGVMFSIAICNMLSPTIDHLVSGLNNNKLGIKWAWIGSIAAISIGLNGGIAYAKAPKSPVVPEPPVIEVWRELVGTATSDVPAAGEYGLTTTTVTMQYDINMTLVGMKIDTPTTGGSFDTSWKASEEKVISYYESLSFEEIKALTPETIAGSDGFVGGLTYTTDRVLAAVQNAVENIVVYEGSATTGVPEAEEYFGEQTVNVVTYVDTKGTAELTDDTIVGLSISGEETTGKPYETTWENNLEQAMSYYKDAVVVDLMELTTTSGIDEFTGGITYSFDRLLLAVKDSLSTVYVG
ncbi:MAG TPA: RnfABCDGE type electron transport complex subunit D [Bacilli bacterium]|nr:RnfABCDGE type electron transport complex subunit D [Bacilli bacterium]